MKTSSRSISVTPWLILLAAIILALVIGLSLAVLPVKASVLGTGFVLSALGALIVLTLPDKVSTPWRMVYFVFLAAIFTRFLWPNYAYIPIAALPTKNPQRALWALAIGYWVYSLATNQELRARLADRLSHARLAWLVLLLGAWRYLSIAAADHPIAAIPAVLLETFEYLPALLFPLTWVRDQHDALRIARWLIFATVVIFAFTVLEEALQQNPFARLVPADSVDSGFVQMALESKMRGGGYRAQATFNHPLLLGQFMAAVVPLIFLVVRADPSRAVRRLAMLLLVAAPLIMLATRTRTSIAVGLLVFGVAMFMRLLVSVRPAPRPAGQPGDGGKAALRGGVLMLLLTAGMIVAAGFVASLVAGRTADEHVSSIARVRMATRALAAIPDSPMFGFGPGQGGQLAADVSSRGVVTLDSYWLLLMLESGLPALILFVLAVAAACTRLRGLRQPIDSAAGQAGWWALVVAAFGISTIGLGTPHNLPLLYLAIGIILALEHPALAAARARPAIAGRPRGSVHARPSTQ